MSNEQLVLRRHEATESEMDVLLASMVSPSLIDTVGLEPHHFSDQRNAEIFRYIRRVYDEMPASHTGGIDPRQVLNAARMDNAIGRIGGTEHLMKVLNEGRLATQVFHATWNANQIKDRWMRRVITDTILQLGAAVNDDRIQTMDMLTEAESRLFALQDQDTTATESVLPIESVMHRGIAAMDNRIAHGTNPDGIDTEFTTLDDMLGGLRRREMTVVGARPSVGKTSFAMNVALNAARRGNRVLFVSLEMATEELADRIAAAEARVNLHGIRQGNVSEASRQRIEQSLVEVNRLPLDVLDNNALKLGQLVSICRKHKRRCDREHEQAAREAPLEGYSHELKLIVIDYLQLIWPDDDMRKNGTRQEIVAEISRRLKGLARELNVAVLVLAQVNRNSAERNAEPELHELRESGAIEQDADAVMFLYREKLSDQEEQARQSRDTDDIKLKIAKNRNGPTGRIDLQFRKAFCLFETPATPEQVALVGGEEFEEFGGVETTMLITEMEPVDGDGDGSNTSDEVDDSGF